MKFLPGLVFLIFLIFGCGGESEATPTPTDTPTVERSSALPVLTVIPTATTIPTPAQAVIPAVTPVPTPVPTVIPTVTPVPTRATIPQLVVESFRTVVAATTEVTVSVLPGATSTPIVLTLNPSNIILEIPPTPIPTPTVEPTATATATPVPPTPTPTPVLFVGTVDVHLTLPEAPLGVSGYIFDVVVGPHVTLVDFKTVFSLSERVGNRIAAADLAEIVGVGAVNVTLGTITFEAVSPGAGPIQINIFAFDDNDGDPINARFDLGFIEVR